MSFKRFHFLELFNRIEFWIGVFILIHLYGISWPPIESVHSWRQATGLMVARNYFEGNTSFFYPMVDETNGASGIIGMEFPVFYYLQGILAKLFGFSDGLGRGIHMIITTIGILYFYKIILIFFDKKTALISTILILCSAFFTFSRKVMPDTACLGLIFIGLYQLILVYKNGYWFHALLAFSFLSLGLLVKISALPLMGFVLFFHAHFKDSNHRFWKILIPLLACVPMCLWYFYWNPFLEKSYGNWYNIGGPISKGFALFLHNGSQVFHHLIFHPFYSYLSIIPILLGVIFLFKNKHFTLLPSFLIFLFLFMLFALKSGEIFFTHDYYILPLVPILSLIAAYGITTIKRYGILILVLICMEGILNQLHDFRWNEGESYKLGLKDSFQNRIPNKSLVAINGNGNPQELYFLHRKGWNVTNETISNQEQRNQIIKNGCDFIIINKRSLHKSLPLRVIFENKDYVLYDIK